MRLLMLTLMMMSFGLTGGCGTENNGPSSTPASEHSTIALPDPAFISDTSLEEALLQRRSIRDYSEEPLSLEQLAQLLWAAQGITSRDGKRTAPSAGGLYPLEVYAVVGNVAGLDPGVYRYIPGTHSLFKVLDGDCRNPLSQAALNQEWVSRGAIDIVITAIYERTTVKYGERGIRYVYMEAGHASQNICLQAVALGLGTVTIGAFDDDDVKKVLNIPDNEETLYIMPVGNIGNAGG